MNWNDFKDHFRRALINTDPNKILAAWDGSAKRTDFYEELLKEKIQGPSKLYLEKEFLKVDFVLSKKVNDKFLPQIWIESENACLTAYHEIRKLCSLQGPLKILLTVIAWDKDQKWKGQEIGIPDGWKKPEELVFDWQKIVDVFAENGMFSGQLGILVGERSPDGQLRFYAFELKPGAPAILENIELWKHPEPVTP